MSIQRGHRHGMASTKEYRSWVEIKRRCCNRSCREYKWYGGRGITVCDEWRESFKAFFDYVGPMPGSDYSIDRIDNDRGYEPGNVRWATPHEQSRNKRSNHKLTVNGVTKIVTDWAREIGISTALIYHRMSRRGWTAEQALFTPVNAYHRRSVRKS